MVLTLLGNEVLPQRTQNISYQSIFIQTLQRSDANCLIRGTYDKGLFALFQFISCHWRKNTTSFL